MKSIYKLLPLIFILGLISCAPKQELENTILIGTIAGPETELVEVAKIVAKERYSLDMHIIPFNDYVEPNRSLAEGEINANMFQHQPYLDKVNANQNIKLVTIGKLFIYPMGVYSEKYKNLKEIPNNAVVAVPKDTSNQTRSLLLLEQANLIKLKDTTNISSISIQDIKENPKKLSFQEVDPAFMVRMLPDLDLAVINTNYAVMGRLYPNRDALIAENKNSLYANIIVVREQDKDKEKFQRLIKSLQSQEVVEKAKELFNNRAVVAW